jgi:hypothetical protein
VTLQNKLLLAFAGNYGWLSVLYGFLIICLIKVRILGGLELGPGLLGHLLHPLDWLVLLVPLIPSMRPVDDIIDRLSSIMGGV